MSTARGYCRSPARGCQDLFRSSRKAEQQQAGNALQLWSRNALPARVPASASPMSRPLLHTRSNDLRNGNDLVDRQDRLVAIVGIDVHRDGDIISALHEVDVRCGSKDGPVYASSPTPVTGALMKPLSALNWSKAKAVTALRRPARIMNEIVRSGNLIQERGRGQGNLPMRSVPRGVHHTTEVCVNNVLSGPISAAPACHVDHPSATAAARARSL